MHNVIAKLQAAMMINLQILNVSILCYYAPNNSSQINLHMFSWFDTSHFRNYPLPLWGYVKNTVYKPLLSQDIHELMFFTKSLMRELWNELMCECVIC